MPRHVVVELIVSVLAIALLVQMRAAWSRSEARDVDPEQSRRSTVVLMVASLVSTAVSGW